MPLMTVLTGRETLTLKFTSGETVSTVLQRHGIQIRIGCSEIGACGLCKIRICHGDITEPTGNEIIMLCREDISKGIRLACQISLKKDITIDVSES